MLRYGTRTAAAKTVQAQFGPKIATMTLDQYGHLFPTISMTWPPRWRSLSACERGAPKTCPQVRL